MGCEGAKERRGKTPLLSWKKEKERPPSFSQITEPSPRCGGDVWRQAGKSAAGAARAGGRPELGLGDPGRGRAEAKHRLRGCTAPLPPPELWMLRTHLARRRGPHAPFARSPAPSEQPLQPCTHLAAGQRSGSGSGSGGGGGRGSSMAAAGVTARAGGGTGSAMASLIRAPSPAWPPRVVSCSLVRETRSRRGVREGLDSASASSPPPQEPCAPRPSWERRPAERRATAGSEGHA